MNTIVQDFKYFHSIFPSLLDESGYKMDFLAKRLGLSPSAFSNKKLRNSFNLDEMQILLEMIWNDYLEDICMSRAIKEGQHESSLTIAQTKKLFGEWR